MKKTVEDLMFLGQEFVSKKKLDDKDGNFEIQELREYCTKNNLELIEVLKGVVALRIMHEAGEYPTIEDVLFITAMIITEDEASIAQ